MRMATLLTIVLLSLFSLAWPMSLQARGEILGIHILSPGEITDADTLLARADDKDQFITVPFTLADLDKRKVWEEFFWQAHQKKLRPILRLTTRFENENWSVPTRLEIVRMATFLSSLEWHRPDVVVILFNEPNHSKEWGGTINPEEFAHISAFSAQWFATEPKDYVVLPAAMDLAAGNTALTMEAFAYWRKALGAEPSLLSLFEAWNSHSYPNPAFASSPSRLDKMSLRGYQHELEFAKQYTDKQFSVYITETGWDGSSLPRYKLARYYREAFDTIWGSDERIVAVTPFLLRGAPGTFAPFSFLDKDGKPTIAYDAYRTILNL